MITNLSIKNFKSLRDIKDLELAPLTGFFGTNSSGKSSILQLLLLLKQTVESTDRNQVLNLGDSNTLVDLGTFSDIIYKHDTDKEVEISFAWMLSDPIKVHPTKLLLKKPSLSFLTSIKEESEHLSVNKFLYSYLKYQFGMKKKNSNGRYDLIAEDFKPDRHVGRAWPLPNPIKSYGFPDETYSSYQNVGFLSQFVLQYENLFKKISYLGPLREYPKRSYLWSGEHPSNIGVKGELSITALLSSRKKGKCILLGFKKRKYTVEERIAYWLREMGLIHSFELSPIAKNRKDYELRVQQNPSSPKVLITDVGFGVSQILPVLVLCYYVPEGSIILFEQPEIHLHPSVQSWLADVFIEVALYRNVQIILESHSEHLLRRLQRRIAEEKIESSKTALYFCRMENAESKIEKLEMNEFGDISNWPNDFFGDDMGELFRMTEAKMKRTSKER